MKRLILIVLLVLAVPRLIPCQNGNASGIIPDKPKQGDMVTITYNPLAEGALLKNAPEINLEVMYVVESLPVSFMVSSYDPKYPVLKEYKMIKTGDVYQASLLLMSPKQEFWFSDSHRENY